MRLPAHIDPIAQEQVVRVRGMERLDLCVFGAVEVVQIVALNRLMKERHAQRKRKSRYPKELLHHCTGTPGWSAHTSVSGMSRISSRSSSGRPMSAGNVPKWIGITRRMFSMRQASAASRGPIV